MAKLADIEFPEAGLDESVDLARRIYDDLGGEVRRDGLAIVLGMSSSGGAFASRIGALRMWGLVSGRGVLKLTEDGIRISEVASLTQRAEIMQRLAASIPLFNELHEKIGNTTIDHSVLAVLLQEITGAEMGEVMRRLPLVERIFEGIREYLDESFDPEAASNHESHTSEETEPLPRGWIEFRYDDGTLRLRETVENVDVLIGTLETRRNKLLGNE